MKPLLCLVLVLSPIPLVSASCPASQPKDGGALVGQESLRSEPAK